MAGTARGENLFLDDEEVDLGIIQANDFIDNEDENISCIGRKRKKKREMKIKNT